ncbi:MAG: hypothetical protein LBC41_07400 [Clostridiales bacterium]|nr:hypothetical protein [Clostridiales bacterium]
MAREIALTPLKWQVGYAESSDAIPGKLAQASVPGAANLDWANSIGMPEWYRDANFTEWSWMEDVFWVYLADIPKQALEQGQSLWLVSGGVDYQYDVYVNNELRYSHEGMFTPFELDVTADMGSELRIAAWPAPKDPLGVKNNSTEAAQCVKPAVSYGWDWHPRLIPVGIWEETGLLIRERGYIKSAEVLYSLSENLDLALLEINASISGEGNARFQLYSPDGLLVVECDADQKPRIENPILWWCNGYGEPSLYSWNVTLYDNGQVLDKSSGRIGFRSITMEMNEGGWQEPYGFPKSRSPVPITLTLNGVPIFCKGTNWVNPEVFTGCIGKETYRPLLNLAKGANMNLLRSWGGAIVNKDSFFDLCDELGLMVWQEFPLACNNYRGTPHYLGALEPEATSIIKRLRSRASLALWCGGNELFNSWSGMSEHSPAIRLLNSLTYSLDPLRPFLLTSPLNGMAHGNYIFKFEGQEVFQTMPKAHFTAYTEFGVASMSNLEVCLAATDMENLFPFKSNPITRAHHAFGMWGPYDTWSRVDTIKSYFGPEDSLKELIDWSQWIQSEGLKCIYEEARRQKPYCSMALNWCYNEPWPAIADNSLVNWPAIPKPSYFAVADSCRPRLASARIPKFSWNPGETFEADLYLLNDSLEALPPGEVAVSLAFCGKTQYETRWAHNGTEANKNLQGPTVRFLIPKEKLSPDAGSLNARPESKKKYEILTLRLESGPLTNEYRLVLYL